MSRSEAKTMSEEKSVKKVVRIGTVPVYENKRVSLYAEVTYTADGRLSIHGVIGPKSNGDAIGSCGQVVMSFKEYDKRGHMTLDDITHAPGWNAETVKRFFDVWDQWHLNDMQAGCKHQRALPEFKHRDVVLVEWVLTNEAISAKNKVRRDVEDKIAKAGAASVIEYDRELFNASYSITLPEGVQPDKHAEWYKEGKKESKNTGWLYQKDHPEGFLLRPCPVCGYKYGSQWLKEEVPEDVLEFLRALPSTDIAPAWV